MARNRVPLCCRLERGLTLVELLVAVVVLGLLIAIGAPSLARARQAARQAVCLSNQRQLVVAWTTYSCDYKCWPLTAHANLPWTQLFYGWGGVHWYGDGSQPGLIPLAKSRPLNVYVAESSLIEKRCAVFRCPLDDGAFDAADLLRPWDSASLTSRAPDVDRFTCFSVAGTSYQANEWMYCKVGSTYGFGFSPPNVPPPHFRFNQSPDSVVVAPNRFVLIGDAGSGSSGRITQATRVQRNQFTAWWHGYEKCQLGFLDGSARLEKMGAITRPSYTFYLDPSRQPFGSRVFAYTW